MATDYQKHLYGLKLEHVDPVTCKNADVSSSHSANLRMRELRCEENAVISVDNSATLNIIVLICKNGKLNVSYSSTLNIEEIECSGTLDIQGSYSSTIRIAAFSRPSTSKIGTTTGLVQYSSVGVCHAKIGRDGVRTEYSSNWIADPW
jgi:hypothetical protein